MIENIVFFNDHGIGDLIWSKIVVQYINKFLIQNQLKTYFFHKFNKNILKFDPSIEVGNIKYILPYTTSIQNNMYSIHCPNLSIGYDNHLFINTWLMYSKSFQQNYLDEDPTKTLVNLDVLAELTNDLIEIIEDVCGIQIPRADSESLFSTCDESLSSKIQIDHFFENNKFSNYVLLCNGNSRSGQTENFDVYDWIEEIIPMFPDWGFIFTEKNFKTSYKNAMVTSTNSVIQNLNNIEYMSTKCKILFTRSTGPGHILFNKNNCLDKNKSIIAYTNHKNTAFLYDKGDCNYVWSNVFTKENVIENFINQIKA
jgi:hypothetical protein